VKKRLRKFYGSKADLKGRAGQIDDVSDLLHIQNRSPEFRVSSAAADDSEYESPSTKSKGRNPEAYFASHNFPFEIIKFYYSCAQPPLAKLNYPQEYRFITKFIWMLANRANFIPVLSLCSFRELAPLFHEVSKEVEWGDRDGQWALSLGDFIKAWPPVSDQFCRQITDKEYKALADNDKRSLAMVLFAASVSQPTAKREDEMKDEIKALLEAHKQIILTGAPGTGKTFLAKEVAAALLGCQKVEELEQDKYKERFGFVQFHPAYDYTDFVEGLKPVKAANNPNNSIGFELRDGIFMDFCKKAAKEGNNVFVAVQHNSGVNW
jgi:hypothetical protein